LIDRVIGQLNPDRKARQLRIWSFAFQFGFAILDFGWKSVALVPPPSLAEAGLRLKIK